jgi:hypothetical protein
LIRSPRYDYDTGVQRRRNEPELYGFVPDGIRGNVVFGCMIINGAVLLLARSASAALLMHADSSYFPYYTLGDCALFFAQKAARRDMRTWIQGDAFFTDFIGQLIFKLVVDYTGLVQFRAPGVLGGCYWTGNMLLALAAPFGAVAVYYQSDASRTSMLDESTSWAVAGCLCATWILVFSILLLLMKPAYRRTFYSTETIGQWVCSFFTKEGATDETKMDIHKFKPVMWKHLRGEVKEWTLANWERIKAEDPEWFNAVLIAKVDEDMIPAAASVSRRS